MRPLVLLLALAAGCNRGEDISGMYQVTLHTSDPMGCGAGAAVTGGQPYFMMKKETLLGHDFFTRYDCPSTDETTCRSGGALLADPTDTGWTGYISVSSPGSGHCTLGYIDYEATILAPDGLRIRTRTFSDDVQLSEAECDPDEAERRGDTMPCKGSEVVEGTLVK